MSQRKHKPEEIVAKLRQARFSCRRPEVEATIIGVPGTFTSTVERLPRPPRRFRLVGKT